VPLVELHLPDSAIEIPRDVRAFLGEAERRVEHFQRDSPVPGFVSSDYESAYRTLHALAASGLAPGTQFCEWGSGFGVVACLAALLEFDACGIEIDAELVESARELARAFDLPVQFVRGSFIPEGGEDCVGRDDYSWLTTDAGRTEDELGLAADDFDVIYAYPWPDEERLTANLFLRSAATGAVLVTHHASGDFRLRRKSRGRKR
jgi:hypothetical protein